jgi:hypothetical protein
VVSRRIWLIPRRGNYANLISAVTVPIAIPVPIAGALAIAIPVAIAVPTRTNSYTLAIAIPVALVVPVAVAVTGQFKQLVLLVNQLVNAILQILIHLGLLAIGQDSLISGHQAMLESHMTVKTCPVLKTPWWVALRTFDLGTVTITISTHN